MSRILSTNNEQAALNRIWTALGGGFVIFRSGWAERLGSIPAALVLERLIYVGRLESDENGWFICTVDTMRDATTLGSRGYASARIRLEKVGLIESSVYGVPPKVHVRIDHEALAIWVFGAESILPERTNVTAQEHERECQGAESSSNKELHRDNKRERENAADAAAPSAVSPSNRQGSETSFPETFVLEGNVLAYARSQGLTDTVAREEWENFHDHAIANGRRQTNWVSAWRLWVRRSVQYSRERARSGPTMRNTRTAGETGPSLGFFNGGEIPVGVDYHDLSETEGQS